MLFFSDTNVLVYFAKIGRIDLLELLLNGKGRWCASVANELSDWIPTYPSLQRTWKMLGDPIYPEKPEYQEIRIVRESMLRPGDGAQKNMGEAETIVVVRNRFSGAVFLTDDRDAAMRANNEKIRVVKTVQLFDLATRRELITTFERDMYLRQIFVD